MKNISIFAHFDKNKIIDDYVIYYLKALKSVSEKVIFVSDCDLSPEELQKLDGIVDFSLAKRHGAYDFGSYKRGWEIAVKNGFLNDADSLTFANDSCYGPFYPLEALYEKMNSKNCDFWGITKNKNYLEGRFFPCSESNNTHVQSYFLVFKNNVFKSDVFVDFMKNIKKEDDKFKVIEKYEIGLSKQLCRAGFSYDTSEPDEIGHCNSIDILQEDGKPFIFMKVSVLKVGFFIKTLSNWFFKLSKYSEYPLAPILKHFKRVRRIQDVKFGFLRKLVIRVHLHEKSIFILGHWYKFGGANA